MTKILKKVLLALACLTLMTISSHASATNIYIAQSSAGAANGADCADAKPVSFFNASGNWGSGSAQIGPGTTVHLCGTFTGAAGSTMLTIQGSGASGSPVTILFESGAQLNAPYWGGNPFGNGGAAIVCGGQNYILVDGGTNGVIQNTANGSASLGYPNQQGSQGIQIQSCNNVEIRNLTINNIYVHANGDTGGENNTQAIGVGYSNFVNVHNNTVSEAYVGIGLGYNPVGSGNVTSANIYSNVIDHACHQISIGDGNSNASASGVNIYSNSIGPHFEDWTASDQSCHSDGMIISAFNSGSQLSNMKIYDNSIVSDMCSILNNPGGNCTGYIFITGGFSNVEIFNNVFSNAATLSGFEGMIRLDPAGHPMTNFNTYNNVFDANNTNAATAGCDCAAIKSADSTGGGSLSGFTAKNNVFQNFTNSALLNETGTFSTTYSGGINYNDYYNVAMIGVDFTGNQRYSSLANWQGAGFDPNGSTVNPSLGSNYAPQSTSPIMSLGTNLESLGITALDSDKAGVARPSTGAWAMGAFQGSAVGAPAPPSSLEATVQ